MAKPKARPFSFIPDNSLVVSADGKDVVSLHSPNLIVKGNERVTIKSHGWDKGRPYYEIDGRRSFYNARRFQAAQTAVPTVSVPQSP